MAPGGGPKKLVKIKMERPPAATANSVTIRLTSGLTKNSTFFPEYKSWGTNSIARKVEELRD